MNHDEDLSELTGTILDYVDQQVAKLRNKVGTVTAWTTGAGTVTVTVDGTSMVLHRLASYAPVVGDQVFIDVSVGNWLILGKIMP